MKTYLTGVLIAVVVFGVRSAFAANPELVIIVNSNNGVESISSNEVADIFLGKSQRLPDGTKVVPLIANLLAEARRWEGPQDSDGGWWCPKTATYTPAGGALEATLVGHTGPVLSVAYSSDGKYIASASRDKSIRVKGILGEVVGKSLLAVKRLRTPSRLLRFGTLILVRLCKRC